MNKSILIAVMLLGISYVGFSQTTKTDSVKTKSERKVDELISKKKPSELLKKPS